MPYAEYKEVPVTEKVVISIREAAAYSGIGIQQIEEMLKQPDCDFLIVNGNRRMTKRGVFRDYRLYQQPEHKNGFLKMRYR